MKPQRMDIPHLISPRASEHLHRVVRSRPLLLAFDLDGTLAPLVARPEAAAIPVEIMKSLQQLEQKTELAILSGRGRADVIRLCSPLSRVHIIGNHGLEHPGVPASLQLEANEICRRWVLELEGSGLLQEPGIFLEDKRSSLSLHYRGAQAPTEAHERIVSRVGSLQPRPKLIAGKFVVNLTPQFAPLKGDALAFLKDALGCKGILFAGDDITDEHAFEWLRRMTPPLLGLGVHIGSVPTTQAHFRLDSVAEVSALLKSLVKLID
jgi:trehalose 6-phosphate phosphatase